jgi:hypothetical protein
MFRVPLLVAVTLAVAFGGGIAISQWALKASTGFGSIRLGPWVAYPNAQTADTDPYAKAHRARAGRLLYGKAEGMRFTAETDDAGRTLSGACAYDIVGNTPPARFWTLFATDRADRPLTAAADGQPSPLPTAVNAWTVLREADSSFVIHVAPTARPGNWLAIREPAPFRLVLTLLDAPSANSSGAIELVMPKILARGCGDA